MTADPAILVERSFTGRSWRLEEPAPDAVHALAQRYALPELVARILLRRGLEDGEVERFLMPRLRDHLPDPSHLNDLETAAERLAQAIEDREPIGIIADYDVDGATSAALVWHYLAALERTVAIEIPDRLRDGYGPNAAAFERLASAGCRLVLVLDAGTTAHEPLRVAKRAGQEVIVVDHHDATDELPPALAIINPKRRDQESPLRSLASVGLTFVLLVAVNRTLRARSHFADCREPDLRRWLDLVALGSVCDVVPLTGLNRAFVAQGLKVAGRLQNHGIAALVEAAGLRGLAEASELGFVLGPRINAAGRLGQSRLGTTLLTSSRDEAERTARVLCELNNERRQLERAVLRAATALAEREERSNRRVVIVAGEGWHKGVIGIVAARLAERFGKPSFVIALDGATGTGSARTPRGFDLGAAVLAAQGAGLLLRAGGHAMAAGLAIEARHLESFRDFLEERLDGLPAGQRLPVRELDARLSLAAATPALAAKLARLAPFGAGHEEPLVLIEDAEIGRIEPVGRDHLAVMLHHSSGARARAMAFRAAGAKLGEALVRGGGGSVALVARLRNETYQGRPRAALEIVDAAIMQRRRPLAP